MNLEDQGPGSRGQGPEVRSQGPGARSQVTDKDFSGPRPPAPGPLRILMLAPTPYFADRGCHVRIFEEARALTDKGHQVRIVTYHLGRDMPPVPVERIISIPWYRKLEAGPSWHKPYLDMLLLIKGLKVAKRFSPHIIHAHLHEGALIGGALARLLKLPLLFDYQGSLSGESLDHGFFSSGSWLHRLFRKAESAINSMADMIITSSTSAAEELAQDWGVHPEKISPLPDGVDMISFRHRSRKEARKRLGISDGIPLFVYLGLLNSYQGIDLLLEAVKMLVARGRAFHIAIMGFPEAAYRQKAGQMNISEFVTFTGRVSYSDAPLLLSAGDIAISPKLSDTEANGKLLNYMACALPVIAFDNRVNREILGEEGIYAENGSVDSLVNWMNAALNDLDTMKKTGERLHERALHLHSWESRVNQLDSFYRKLLKLA